jgi:hypothetical protein
MNSHRAWARWAQEASRVADRQTAQLTRWSSRKTSGCRLDARGTREEPRMVDAGTWHGRVHGTWELAEAEADRREGTPCWMAASKARLAARAVGRLEKAGGRPSKASGTHRSERRSADAGCCAPKEGGHQRSGRGAQASQGDRRRVQARQGEAQSTRSAWQQRRSPRQRRQIGKRASCGRRPRTGRPRSARTKKRCRRGRQGPTCRAQERDGTR